MSENGHARSVAAPTTHDHLAGEVIGRHVHDHHQLVQVSTGVLAVRTGEASWVASSARAMWLPAGIWHEHRVYGHTSVHTLAFAVDDAPLPADAPTVVAVDALVRELTVACSDPALPPAEAARIRAVLRDRLRRARAQPMVLPVARDPRLARACELVTEDLAQPRTVAWLARRAGAGERTLARLFRSEFGMTYPQWRAGTRVFRAMIHLAEGATVTETARRCGWATTSAFIDTFTRTTGQTPGGYRAAAAPP
ncbi:AraC family transcriptional regulator [Streptomyces sp. NPDC050560]|uniref:AraC family transcriptional regulator n=1 Tax=Streptomyces sp. NPDC050560 TaxID=3365630 RepID=UPI0037B2F064